MEAVPSAITQPTPRTGSHGLRLLALLTLLTLLALLAGCAGTTLVDNTVRSFSALESVPAPAGYRFERLPSQRQDPAQPRLEAMADASLARVGLRRDDAAPVYSVQVWARGQQTTSPWTHARRGGWNSWGSLGLGTHRGVGVGVGIGFPLGVADAPWYQREVGLILREVASGRVVYETQAFNDGYWIDPNRAWPAMLDAALQGFPRPPQGERRVDVQIPR